MIKECTYGCSLGGHHLVRILNEIDDNEITRSVGRRYKKYLQGLREIDSVEDEWVREYLFKLWKKEFKTIIFEDEKLPQKIKTHLYSVLKAAWNDSVERRVA